MLVSCHRVRVFSNLTIPAYLPSQDPTLHCIAYNMAAAQQVSDSQLQCRAEELPPLLHRFTLLP